MEFFGLILLLIFSLLVVVGTLSRRTRAKYSPGPMALPFIGNIHLMNPPLFRMFSKLSERYGPLMYLRFGPTRVFVASSPETVAEIFKSNDVTFANRPPAAATERLSYGYRALPFIPYGPNWAFLKKMISTELLGSDRNRTKELHRFIGDMVGKSRSGDSVNFTWEMVKMSRNTMSQMLMSKRLYGDDASAKELEGLIRRVIQVGSETNASIFNVFTFIKHIFGLDGHMQRVEDLFQRFDTLIERIITEREEVRKRKRSGEEERDLLDVMLNLMEDESSNYQITKDHIKAILLDTMVAGTESSAVTLDWTLGELLKQPEIMKKAQQEVDEVVGTARLVNASDNKRLTYIQAIVKESLRLHAPIPLMGLTSSKDCEISGFTIPSKSILFVNIWGIMRDPKVWDNALEFRPERFLNESMAAKLDVRGRHYELLPFGTGKRSCPAINYSMNGLTTALAAILQCFDWKLKGEVVDIEKVLHAGPGAPRLHPLECFPIARFTPPNLAAY